mgnify:CR=1 FL=1
MLVPYARKNHTVSNFNPFHDFDELERAFFSDNALSEFKTDIQEDGDNFVLEADLPGFKKDEIHIELKNGYLTISAAKGLDKDEKTSEGKYIRQERYTGACSRSFYVGTDLQPKDVSAKFTDGILELTFPKEAPKKEPDVTRVEIGE